MKNLLLSLMCALLVSFSFGQDKSIKGKKPALKQNSVKAVEYLTKNLKLDPKQKAIFMNVYAKYADNITTAIKKTTKNTKEANLSPTVNRDDKKEIYQYMLRFAVERDNKVKECLKKKQVSKYDDLIKSIHPFTLEVREKKKK